MPQPADVAAKGTIFNKPLADGSGANQVYVSPNHRLSARRGNSPRSGSISVNYAVVVDPKTKQQTVYQREYNVLGQEQPLDPDKILATKGPDGKFVPSDYATQNIDSRLVDKLNDNEATQATLNNVVDYTVKSSLQQTSADGKASPVDVADVKGEGIEDNGPANGNTDQTGGNSAEENVGDGSLNATQLSTVASPNQDTTNLGKKNDLVYPEGAKGNESDYIKFTALKYLPSKMNTGGGSFGTTYQEGTAIGQSVQLPIQGGIQDSNAVGWNEDNLNALQAAGAEMAQVTIGQGFSAGVDNFIKQMGTVSGESGEVKKAIEVGMAGQAVGSNIIGRTERAVFNPNMELLFQGPQLRAFSFNFKMTPRGKNEAETVKAIIKFFKFHMAPKTSDANLFLKAPNIFKIEYFNKGQQHTGINLIKDCALQSCTVNYTPDGTYMSYEDGAMFSYDLQLQFMELIPVYAKDYNEGDGANHPIGY
jgi:hypothetical protein